jgi:hypothetical protein
LMADRHEQSEPQREQQHCQQQQEALLQELNACLAAFASRSSGSTLGTSGMLAPVLAPALQLRPASVAGAAPPHKRKAAWDAGTQAAAPSHTQPDWLVTGAASAVPLNSDWPLCPFELRGTCQDSACR